MAVLFGGAVTLVVTVIVQWFLVPRVEARKRREDRWERQVLELGELLTTKVAEAQSALRLELHRAVARSEDAERQPESKRNLFLLNAWGQAKTASDEFDRLYVRLEWLTDRVLDLNHGRQLNAFQAAAIQAQHTALQLSVAVTMKSTDVEAIEQNYDNSRRAAKTFLDEVNRLSRMPAPRPRPRLWHRDR